MLFCWMLMCCMLFCWMLFCWLLFCSTSRKVAKMVWISVQFRFEENDGCFLGASYLISSWSSGRKHPWVLPKKLPQSYNGREFKPNMQLFLGASFSDIINARVVVYIVRTRIRCFDFSLCSNFWLGEIFSTGFMVHIKSSVLYSCLLISYLKEGGQNAWIYTYMYT